MSVKGVEVRETDRLDFELVGYTLFGLRLDPATKDVMAATYFLNLLNGCDEKPRTYRLEVLSERDAESRQLEMSLDEEISLTDRPYTVEPLVFDGKTLGHIGLRGWVESEYLDPNNPRRINDIRTHLEGPLDDILPAEQ